MRKVEIFEYIKNTGKREKVKVADGFFHQFGTDYEEFENGPGNFTTAIVETSDGEILNVPIHLVKFIKNGEKTEQIEANKDILLDEEMLDWKSKEKKKSNKMVCSCGNKMEETGNVIYTCPLKIEHKCFNCGAIIYKHQPIIIPLVKRPMPLMPFDNTATSSISEQIIPPQQIFHDDKCADWISKEKNETKLEQILELKFDSSDFAKEVTIREYLIALLSMLWVEQEEFDSKRSYGNSDWTSDIEKVLLENGFVKTGKLIGVDREWFEPVDKKELDDLMLDVIQRMCEK